MSKEDWQSKVLNIKCEEKVLERVESFKYDNLGTVINVIGE